MKRLLVLRPGERLAVAVAVGVFVLILADVAVGGLVADLDADAIASVALSDGGPAWTRIATDLGSLGVSGAVVMIATLLCAHGLWRVWPLALTAFNLAATAVVVSVVKAAVGRGGPSTTASNSGYSGYFPSGHTATGFVCFGTAAFLMLALVRPDLSASGFVGSRAGEQRPGLPEHGHDILARAGVGVGLTVGLVVGIGTLLTGNHWPSDVVGGLLVGTTVLVTGFAGVRTHLEKVVGVRR
ncbi:MAG: phosphatase PAP2 family protein [Nocardioidaceae bacterium]|nr:phosphatase PAP2 family protein [Nocardioidaceae bacterium]